MKEYNKEKLHEYAKELFTLCLEKGIRVDYQPIFDCITLLNSGIFKNRMVFTYLGYDNFKNKESVNIMPIWELIEKVKAL